MRSALGPVVFTLFVASCGPAVTTLPPPPPPGPAVGIPDMHGSWRGTWGGAPAALLITDQQTSAGYSGIYVGSYQVFGHERPGVSGILTSQVENAQTSVRAAGWFGGAGNQLTLVILTDSPSGQQRITVRPDGPDRLIGIGESNFRGGPNGPIELRRVLTPR